MLVFFFVVFLGWVSNYLLIRFLVEIIGIIPDLVSCEDFRTLFKKMNIISEVKISP